MRSARSITIFCLKKKHFLNHDAQSLLALGEDLFAKTKQELAALAEELGPGKGIEEVARKIQDNHPSIDQILSAYQKAMEAAREFVKREAARLISAEGRTARRAIHRNFAATKFLSPPIYRPRRKIPTKSATTTSRR